MKKQKANGIQLNVRDQGQGEPALVFLHYWGGSSRTWDLVINRLKTDFSRVAYDQRGWGDSDGPETGYSLCRSIAGILVEVRSKHVRLGAAAFFGVGIGQLERAGLGCQAKNQPCFSDSLELLGESHLIVLGLFIRVLISFGNTQYSAGGIRRGPAPDRRGGPR